MQVKEVQAWSSQHQPSTQPGARCMLGRLIPHENKHATIPQSDEMLNGYSEVACRVPRNSLSLAPLMPQPTKVVPPEHEVVQGTCDVLPQDGHHNAIGPHQHVTQRVAQEGV